MILSGFTAAALLVQCIPLGAVMPFPGDIPDGWLPADGSQYDNEYVELWDVIDPSMKTIVGVGDDVILRFWTPDLRARSVVGAGTVSESGRTTKAVGSSGGAETHVLTTSEMPSHNHALPSNILRRADSGSALVGLPGAGTLVAYNTAHNTQFTGGGAAHNNMSPYLALNYAINAQVCPVPEPEPQFNMHIFLALMIALVSAVLSGLPFHALIYFLAIAFGVNDDQSFLAFTLTYGLLGGVYSVIIYTIKRGK